MKNSIVSVVLFGLFVFSNTWSMEEAMRRYDGNPYNLLKAKREEYKKKLNEAQGKKDTLREQQAQQMLNLLKMLEESLDTRPPEKKEK